MTLATLLLLNQFELDRLFEASLEVTVLVGLGCGYPKYAHYHLHAPFQLLTGRFGGRRLTAEDVGKAMHQLWKRLSQHTTRGRARCKLGKARASVAGDQ